MIKTISMLLEELKDYSDPYGKIRRMCAVGSLIQLKRGIYETDSSVPGYMIAPVLYGPSYLSFEYALSRHGLIPETVKEYTSATCAKGRRKVYTNDFGVYSYRDVPVEAFPYGVLLMVENGRTYMLASAEKALCDKLYALSPVRSLRKMESLLTDDLRIDMEGFFSFDAYNIDEYAKMYHSDNIHLLAAYLRRSQ